MSAATALARGRAAAETLMVDSATITRSAAGFTNPDTGEQASTITTIYTGKCRIQQRVPGGVRPGDAGEAYDLMLSIELQIPMSVTGVQVGDIVTVTACAHDPDLPGRRFLVRELAHKTHATARRIGLEEAT